MKPHGTCARYERGCRCPACKAAKSERGAADRARRMAIGLAPDDPRHGTENAYNNWGCRCAVCVEGMAELRRGRPKLAPDDPRHGLYSTRVNHGCTCKACKRASADYVALLRAEQRRVRLLGDKGPKWDA